MDPYSAIAVRKSCRKYDMSHLPDSVLDEVRALTAAPRTIDDDAGITLHVIEDGGAMADIMPGLVGAYGKVRSPHYLLGIGPNSDAAYENAGYALEPVVLAMNEMRLGTCWIGGSARGDAFRSLVTYPADHAVLIIVAFGLPAEDGGHVRRPGTGNRKPLEELLLAGTGEWGSEIEAARLAPSAGNLQPWRFLAEDDRLHAFMRFKPPLHYRVMGDHLRLMNHLDVGIALAHVRVAAEQVGRPVRIVREHVSAPDGLTYVATAVRE